MFVFLMFYFWDDALMAGWRDVGRGLERNAATVGRDGEVRSEVEGGVCQIMENVRPAYACWFKLLSAPMASYSRGQQKK